MSRTYADPEFEPRVADWLEADPDLAPPEVLATVHAAFPSIPQRRASRVPRRFQTMNRFALFGAAAAIIVVAGLGGLVLTLRAPTTGTGEATPSPAAPSTPPANSEMTKIFNSGRHGYTINYPDDWNVTPATATWVSRTETLWGDPANDVLQGTTARLIAASQPLSDGQTPEQWYETYCRLGGGNDGCADFATTWAPITIGGQPGYVDIDGLPALPGSIAPGAPMYDAVAVVDGRGYEFTLDGRVDRALFDRLLASVTYTPARPSALDNLTSRFTSGLYGYAIDVDPGWTTTAATVPQDDPASTDESNSDRIKVSGTDTTIGITETSLAGQSPDAWLQDAHQAVIDDPNVPYGCKGDDPSSWPPVTVGTHAGVVMTLCNSAQAFVNFRGRMYAFSWGHETFEGSRHLEFAEFKHLLTTVGFDVPEPSPSG